MIGPAEQAEWVFPAVAVTDAYILPPQATSEQDRWWILTNL